MEEFSLTTFSSTGTLPQIENALAAVNKGETTIGILITEALKLKMVLLY